MLVMFDICTDITIDLDEITFWDFCHCETVDNSSLTDKEKIAALNGTSERYCIYSIGEVLSKGDIGDYEFLNIQVKSNKL